MSLKPFNPRGGGTILIANAVTAAAAVSLHEFNDQFVFYNSSATAIAFIQVTSTPNGDETAAIVTSTTGFPIPPASQIRLTFGFGKKKITAVASASDGNLYVSAGTGN